MFSQTILVGHLGADPEIYSTGTGKKVAHFRMATSRPGNGETLTEWHNVTAWGDGLVGVVEKYLHKGDAVVVTGENRTRSYEKDGVKHYATDVVVGFNGTIRFVDVKGASPDQAHAGGEEGAGA